MEEEVFTKVVSFMEGEWSCFRGGQFNRQFNGGRMVMLQRWAV